MSYIEYQITHRDIETDTTQWKLLLGDGAQSSDCYSFRTQKLLNILSGPVHQLECSQLNWSEITKQQWAMKEVKELYFIELQI